MMHGSSFYKKILLVSCSLFALLVNIKISSAQADTALKILKIIPANAVNFTTDNLGNIYFITADNRLEKYDMQSDTTFTYNNLQYGTLTSVDATNPLHLLLFYPDFGTIIMLDRLLAFQNKIDLRDIGIFKADAVAASYDNNIWVYDGQSAQLKKIDLSGTVLLESVDLRQLLNEAPSPNIILDQGGHVYMSDPNKGIFVFDDYAAYKNELHYQHIRSLQYFKNQLIFFHDDSLTTLNLQDLAEKNMQIPAYSSIIKVSVQRDRLYVLSKQQLSIYQLP